MTAWLARNPRITLHFTPTSGSWLNLVEIFFGIITRQAIRRGSFTSVRDLTGMRDACGRAQELNRCRCRAPVSNGAGVRKHNPELVHR